MCQALATVGAFSIPFNMYQPYEQWPKIEDKTITQNCYNLINQSLIGCVDHFNSLSFNSSQNTILLLFFSQLFSSKEAPV